MNDTLLLIIVPVVALGGLAGMAYWLQRRARKNGAIANLVLPTVKPLCPVGRSLLWVTRILVAIMIISVIAYFVFGSLWIIWIAFGSVALRLIVGWVGRFVRLTGK